MDAIASRGPPDSEHRWYPPGTDHLALVLQGGGALGAYQAGVYQALHEARLWPDSVAGVSIGGINSAIIAGNPPERRLERLREFWETVTAGRGWPFLPEGDDVRKMHNMWSSLMTIAFGQPGSLRLGRETPGSVREAPDRPPPFTIASRCGRHYFASSTSIC